MIIMDGAMDESKRKYEVIDYVQRSCKGNMYLLLSKQKGMSPDNFASFVDRMCRMYLFTFIFIYHNRI